MPLATARAVPVVTPTVQSLPVEEFTATYSPMYYAGTWDDVKAMAEDDDPDLSEYSEHFLASGTSGMDFDELVCSVEGDGIIEPVDVVGGEVEDGHHRVVAAMYAGKPVPFRVWS